MERVGKYIKIVQALTQSCGINKTYLIVKLVLPRLECFRCFQLIFNIRFVQFRKIFSPYTAHNYLSLRENNSSSSAQFSEKISQTCTFGLINFNHRLCVCVFLHVKSKIKEEEQLNLISKRYVLAEVLGLCVSSVQK